MKDVNKGVKDGPFLLLYPDGTEVIKIPGIRRPFTLAAYKAEVGKSYRRITVFICLKRHIEEVGNLSDLSDSDPEIVIKNPQSLILLIHCHGNLWMKAVLYKKWLRQRMVLRILCFQIKHYRLYI
ncbi:hypothetical protein GOODEAATRI_017405 [Goodea atripinnis]|uniref:Uncharacterized protein n=1 Tax=Goodea atripinnis TaxID=208336 RepID=A0ABV0P5M7_9TELE